MSKTETLQKIRYDNLVQFLEDINKNFAVIETSPFYKGIPGDDGIPGDIGNTGLRGSTFLFVKLDSFNSSFDTIITSSSKIDLQYLNSKLSNFESKTKLLKALNINLLIHGDIVVLTNSIMVSYDAGNNIFLNTGLAFNEQTSFTNDLEEKIEKYIKNYIENESSLQNIKNVFQPFDTYAKSYADTNNAFITNSLTDSSIYCPYIEGLTTTQGIKLTDHKYFGYTDNEFPRDNNGTMVFGSIKKYVDLLMKTISTSTEETLSSDYAPGVGNIPGLVLLQDTYENGFMFGYKGKPNLKRFGKIFKNESDEVIIRSDMGKIPSEYADLILHRDYLRFKKLVQFYDDLELSRDLHLFGNFDSKYFRTGKYVSDNNTNTISVGEKPTANKETITEFVSTKIKLKEYLDNTVLVIDKENNISKDYSIENTILNNDETTNLEELTEGPISDKKFLTSNFFNFLRLKINSIQDYIRTNYFTKNDFTDGSILELKTKKIEITEETKLSEKIVSKYINVDNLLNVFKLGALKTKMEIISDEVYHKQTKDTYTNYPGKVFVTDNNGLLLKSYFIETNTLSNDLLPDNNITSEKSIITGKHFSIIYNWIKKLKKYVEDDFVSVNKLTNNTISKLILKDSIVVSDIFDITNRTVTLTNTISDIINIASENISLLNIKDKVLVTDSAGKIKKTITLGVKGNMTNNNGKIGNVIAGSKDEIASTDMINILASAINSITADTGSDGSQMSDYVLKSSLTNGNIGTFIVKSTTKLFGDVFLGGSYSNKDYALSIEDKLVTFKSNTINFETFKDKVLVTDSTGNIVSIYSIDTKTSLSNSDGKLSGTIGDSGGILTANILTEIFNAVNSLFAKFENYYTISDFNSGINKILKFTGDGVFIGPANLPFIANDGNNLTIGKNNSGILYFGGESIRFKKYQNISIVSLNANGEIVNTYSVSTNNNTTSPTWNNNCSLGDGSTSILPNKNDVVYLVNVINTIKVKLKTFVTSDDIDKKLIAYLPSGSIIMWSGSSVPSGWKICDGNNGTPNLINKFVRGSNTPNATGGSDNISITEQNLPPHKHSTEVNIKFDHSHTAFNGGVHTHKIGYINGKLGDDANTRNNIAVGTPNSWVDTNSSGTHSHTISTTYYTYYKNLNSTDGNGTSEQISIIPSYYSLLYIMKI